jgi:PhnB protein
MAQVSTYLNFPGNTEKAFNFYRKVFRTDFIGNISRFKDVPPADAMPPLSEADGNLVMNIALPILGGHILMGTDAIESNFSV